jgi:hypothetical protein
MVTDTMLRLPALIPGTTIGRIIMGNAAVAGELASIDELDELYRLDASEGEPAPEGGQGDDSDGGDGDGDDNADEGDNNEDDDGPGLTPPVIVPDDMPHP